MVGKCSGIISARQVFSISLLCSPPPPGPGRTSHSQRGSLYPLCWAAGGRNGVLLPEGCGHRRSISRHSGEDPDTGCGLRAQPQSPGGPPLESASSASYLTQGPNGICPSVDRKLILIKSSQRSGSIQCQQQMESVSDPSKVSLDEVAW